MTLESLSRGVFEWCASTGSEVFFILKHRDAAKFVFVSVFTIIEMINFCQNMWAKPPFKINGWRVSLKNDFAYKAHYYLVRSSSLWLYMQ